MTKQESQERAEQYDNMTVRSLDVKNFQGLKVFSTGQLSHLVVLVGDNGSGKSSAMNAISAAIGGKNFALKEPVNNEARGNANVEIDLGDLVISRSYSKKTGKSTLEVIDTNDGDVVRSPAALLEAFKANLSFKPLAFSEAKPAEQVNILKELCGVADQVDTLDQQYKEVYEERRVNNTITIKGFDEQIAGIGPIDEDTPDEPINLIELNNKIKAANTANQEHNRLLSEKAANERASKEQEDRIQRLKQDLAAAEQRAQELVEDSHRINGELKTAEQNICDVSPMLEQMANSQKINAEVDKKQRVADLRLKSHQAQQHSDLLTKKLTSIKEQRIKLIAESALPVDGLSFDDDGIYINDVPFSQVSMAERIRASAAIGMAANPKLKVMMIHDAIVMDNKSMHLLIDLAKEKGYQLWLEMVGTARKDGPAFNSGGTVIYITEGEITDIEQG